MFCVPQEPTLKVSVHSFRCSIIWTWLKHILFFPLNFVKSHCGLLKPRRNSLGREWLCGARVFQRSCHDLLTQWSVNDTWRHTAEATQLGTAQGRLLRIQAHCKEHPNHPLRLLLLVTSAYKTGLWGSMIQCSKAPTAQKSHTVKDQLKLVIIKKRMGKIPLFWLSKIPVFC